MGNVGIFANNYNGAITLGHNCKIIAELIKSATKKYGENAFGVL